MHEPAGLASSGVLRRIGASSIPESPVSRKASFDAQLSVRCFFVLVWLSLLSRDDRSCARTDEQVLDLDPRHTPMASLRYWNAGQAIGPVAAELNKASPGEPGLGLSRDSREGLRLV
ncbi:hypothetical protein PtB15_6B69 [Puccinia triticina]|nr:hypothetical protein PtB15_6B69 [Puccinia triticina]